MRLEWVRDLDRFAPEWRALHHACPEAHPFHSPEWVMAWYSTVGRLFWPRVLAGYEGRELVAVWPFAATLRTWYVAGTGVSDYLEPLSRRLLTTDDISAMFDFLHEVRPAMLDFHQLPEDFPPLPGSQAFEQATCLRRTLPSTYGEFQKSLSASLRQDIRKANQNPDLRVEWVEGEQFLPIFFELHGKRWRSRRLPGAFVLSGRRRFHERFACGQDASDLRRFAVLWHGESAIGALYGMRSGNRAFFYQTGFDPDASKLSPGTALIAAFVERSIEEGAQVFDFLRGEEKYKQRWRPDRIRHNVRQIWPAESSVVAEVAKLHQKVDRWLRDRLET